MALGSIRLNYIIIRKIIIIVVRIIISFILFLAYTPSAFACMPVLPLLYSAMPASGLGMFLGAHHQFGFSMAILGIVVLFKSILFAVFEKQNLDMLKGFGLMLLGNVVSTIVGIISAIVTFGMGLYFLALISTFMAALIPAQRGSYFLAQKNIKISSLFVALILQVLAVFSIFLFGLANSQLQDLSQFVWYQYWPAKVIFVIIGVAVSMLLSTFWEEFMIAKLGQKLSDKEEFFSSVLRANLYTFLFVGTFGALLALPARFQSPTFLISLFS